MPRTARSAVMKFPDRRSEISAATTEAEPINAKMELEQQVGILDELISKPPTRSRVLEIGPALAEHILNTRNTSNRPVKPQKVKEYANSLLTGKWGLTGDTLKFGDNGVLVDGQNRLAAVVRANGPALRTHVVFGVAADLFARMDIGKNRTPADVFYIAGLNYAAQSAAAVRWLNILTSDKPNNRGAHFTNEELLTSYRAYNPVDVEKSVRLALELKKTMNVPIGPAAALHFLFARQDAAKAETFFTEWTLGQGGPRSAPKMLQTRLAELGASTGGRVHENVRNAFIIKAWHAYRDEMQLKKVALRFDPADALPAI